MRILLTVPRFGGGIVGGAERLALEIATCAVGEDDDLEVATTCAVDHHTWANALPPGVDRVAGLTVRRFPVGARDVARHQELRARLALQGRLRYADELELMGTDVWSAELQTFLEREGNAYDLLLFTPYLFGTTFWGAQAWPERSALIPCLHDEPHAYLRCMRQVIESCAGCLFNSAAEERLARRLYRVRGGGVVGLGFDHADRPEARSPSAPASDYFIYAGRLEEAKRVDVAVEYVERFAHDEGRDVKLVLIGSGPYTPPRSARTVVPLGWVSEDEKRSLMAGAVALVHPSELESLSIVLMEAWLMATPAIVAHGSEVMRDHCAASGGGLTFAHYDDFAEAAVILLDNPDRRDLMGASGREYVLSTSSWEAVRDRFRAVTHKLVTSR